MKRGDKVIYNDRRYVVDTFNRENIAVLIGLTNGMKIIVTKENLDLIFPEESYNGVKVELGSRRKYHKK